MKPLPTPDSFVHRIQEGKTLDDLYRDAEKHQLEMARKVCQAVCSYVLEECGLQDNDRLAIEALDIDAMDSHNLHSKMTEVNNLCGKWVEIALPAVKSRSRADEKLSTIYCNSQDAAYLGDINRLTLLPSTPQVAEKIVERIRPLYEEVWDSGWRVSPAFRFDRALYAAEEGYVAEILVKGREQYAADEKGHGIYEMVRLMYNEKRQFDETAVQPATRAQIHSGYNQLMYSFAGGGFSYPQIQDKTQFDAPNLLRRYKELINIERRMRFEAMERTHPEWLDLMIPMMEIINSQLPVQEQVPADWMPYPDTHKPIAMNKAFWHQLLSQHNPTDSPEFVLMAGGSLCGKTTATKVFRKMGKLNQDALLLNPDVIQMVCPELRLGELGRHPEKSPDNIQKYNRVRNQLVLEALQNGVSVILDDHGDDLVSLIGLMRCMATLDTPPETAMIGLFLEKDNYRDRLHHFAITPQLHPEDYAFSVETAYQFANNFSALTRYFGTSLLIENHGDRPEIVGQYVVDDHVKSEVQKNERGYARFQSVAALREEAQAALARPLFKRHERVMEGTEQAGIEESKSSHPETQPDFGAAKKGWIEAMQCLPPLTRSHSR